MHGQRITNIQLGVKCEVSCNEWLIPVSLYCHPPRRRGVMNCEYQDYDWDKNTSFIIFNICILYIYLRSQTFWLRQFFIHGEKGGNDVRRPLLNLRPRNIVCVSSLLSTYYHPLKPFLTKCLNNFHISDDFKVVDCFGQNVFQNDERPHKIFNYTSAVSRADKFQRQLTICFWTCQINPTNQFLLQLYFLSSA